MNISIIGTGYVGLVTGTCFAEVGHNILCIDQDLSKIEALRAGRVPIFEPQLAEMIARNSAAGRLQFSTSTADAVAHGEIIFIAVHTPPKPDGSSDMQFIDTVARQIASHLDSRYRIIADKSTVPVQTGDEVARVIRETARPGADFDVISNPEFMREGSAVADQMNPDRIVVGLPKKSGELVRRAEPKLRELFAPWITKGAPFLVTDIASAELIKHAANSFLSLKISYVNALAHICELSGADITQVADGMGLDKRIGRSFLNAGIGYGGSCFPKDIAGFLHIARDLGCDFRLLAEVQLINEQALERFLGKIRTAFSPANSGPRRIRPLSEKTFAVLGIAFKPNTDDIRNAPALALISALQADGARVRAYDPQAMDRARSVTKDVVFCRDAYDAAEGADALIIATEWEEFRRLDLNQIKSKLRQPYIFDGRNLFDPATMKAAGFHYVSVGR